MKTAVMNESLPGLKKPVGPVLANIKFFVVPGSTIKCIVILSEQHISYYSIRTSQWKIQIQTNELFNYIAHLMLFGTYVWTFIIT